MKFFTTPKNVFLRNICLVLIVISFVFAPLTHSLSPKKADAFLGDSVSGTALMVKEYVLDLIVWMIINLVLEEIIKSLTDWVNNGFKNPDGSKGPAFVTDLGGFLLDVGDKAVGEFLLEKGPLEFLCSPFKLDIKLALEIQYQGSSRYKPQCTLSDAVDNMDAFLAGDFSQGGWDGWASLTLNPQNNVYGAMWGAQGAMSASISGARGRELNLLEFGGGFFTERECEADASGKQVCTYNTPGKVIQEGLTKSLNIGNERLEIADEIDELLGALLSQLVGSVLGGAGGLRGYDASKQSTALDPIQAAGKAQSDAIIQQQQQGAANAGATAEPTGAGHDQCTSGYLYNSVLDICMSSSAGGGAGSGIIPGGANDPCGGDYVYNPATGYCVQSETQPDLTPDNNGCIGIGCTPCTGSNCGLVETIHGDPAINGVYAGSCNIDIVASFWSAVSMTAAQCSLVNQTISDGITFEISPSTGRPYAASGGRLSDAIEAIVLVCGGDGDSGYICGFPNSSGVGEGPKTQAQIDACISYCYSSNNCTQSASLCPQHNLVNSCISARCN